MPIVANYLTTLDHAYWGEPFANLGPPNIDFGTLDWAYGAEPFYAYNLTAGQAQQAFIWVST